MARLPKMEACGEGRELVVTGSSTVKVADVLVGEVWFCCGQSNTELPLVGGNPHFSDRQGRLVAQMTRKPLVRFVYASDYKFSVEPKTMADYHVAWKTFTPQKNIVGAHVLFQPEVKKVENKFIKKMLEGIQFTEAVKNDVEKE